jgi:hypothetical protein
LQLLERHECGRAARIDSPGALRRPYRLSSDAEAAAKGQIDVARPIRWGLVMSGFTDGMLVLTKDEHFLDKPFVPSQLLALVADIFTADKNSKFSN